MGRKSLATVRTDEILTAFERCIIEHGLQGCSLSRVAEVAGVQKSVIAHYFGNRAGLIEALRERVVQRYQNLFSALSVTSGAKGVVDVGLSFLFSETFRDHDLALLSRELVAASLHDPVVRDGLARAFEAFEQAIFEVLSAEFPAASSDDRRTAAVGILCLAEGSVQLAGYGQVEARARARQAAAQLVARLRG